MKNYLTALMWRAALAVLVLGLISSLTFAGQVRRPGPIPSGRPAPCCGITAINTATGMVSAKENATGRMFQFKVNDGAMLNSLKVGQGVYANFAASQVSVDNLQPCCTIVSSEVTESAATAAGPPPSLPPDGIVTSVGTAATSAAPAAVGLIRNKVAPVAPCCTITAINASTDVITATVNATGKTFQFQVADSALLNSLKIGQGVYANFAASQVSVDNLQPCCGIVSSGVTESAATAAGQPPNLPPDGIVTSVGTAATSAGVARQGVPQDVRTPQSAGGKPSSTGAGLAHTVPGQALLSPGLPSVTAGTPQRLQGGFQQVPSGNLVRYGSSGSSVNQDVVHLRGAAGIQQVTGLPDGAKNLLLLHVNTLAPGEIDHYIVNKRLAADWIAAHPALAKVQPPASSDSGAGCKATILHPCLGADVKHAEGQVSAETQKLLDAGRKEWQDGTHELAHDLQMVETCFADQTLQLNDVPVEISPSDVPDLTFSFDKGGKPNSAVKANNQFGAITGSANVTGTLTFGLPMDAHFKAGLDMFWIECLPFFIRPKNIHADGTFALGTKIGAELTAAGQFTQEFNIAAGRIPIALIPIVIAGIPIAEMDVSAYMEGKVLVDGNGRLDAQFSLETQRQTNDFDFACSGHRCDLNSHGGATKPETTSESVKLDGRIHVKPEVYTALQLDFDLDALTARAGPQPYLLGEVYACGAASGTQAAGAPSTSQDSYALTADLDWGIDLRAEALVGGALVGDRAIKKLLPPRHIAFWDLAHSTALIPRAEGVTQAAMGTAAVYTIKMPTCYPYPDKVKYQLAWTGGATASNVAPGATTGKRSMAQQPAALKVGGNGTPSPPTSATAPCNLQSGQGSCEFDPVKDFSLDLAWPSAGNYNLTVIAVGDTPHGREYKSAQATTLNVTVGSPAAGATSSSGSGSGNATSSSNGGTPSAGTQTSSSTLVTGNLQPYTQPPPDPNPNHLPDLVFDNSSSGGLSECSIPAGSSCQAACGSKKIPHNFGVHNLTQYPANGPIQIILTEIASGATRSWTLNHVDGNQWAFSGGFYTMWPCPTTTSFPGSGPPDNYTLEVQGPPQLTTNGKTQQLYIPPDAVFCSGNPGFSGCQQ